MRSYYNQKRFFYLAAHMKTYYIRKNVNDIVIPLLHLWKRTPLYYKFNNCEILPTLLSLKTFIKIILS